VSWHRMTDDLIQLSCNTDWSIRRLFSLMAASIQPMTQSEIQNALAIRPGATEHRKGRVSDIALITKVAGSLLRFERHPVDIQREPALKFVHKSVLDFLTQDPASLGLKPDLHRFFVDPTSAHLELGRNCLTYLQYETYQDAKIIPQLLPRMAEPQHAFLRYAAAFWVQHLMCVNGSKELFEEVQTFIRSSAFWTCVAIQSLVVPHMFGRYTKVKRGSYSMNIRGTSWRDGDNIGFPLPDWIEDYGKAAEEICQSFLTFLKEWHEVLATYPQATDQCIMCPPEKVAFPGKASMESKRIKIWCARGREGPSRVSNMYLESIYFRKSTLCARVIYKDGKGPDATTQWREFSVFPEGPSVSGSLPSRGSTNLPKAVVTVFKNSRVSLLNLDDLGITYYGNESGYSTKPCDIPDVVTAGEGKPWNVITESEQVAKDGHSLHVTHVSTTVLGAQKDEEEDSGYASSEGNEYSDDEEEDGSNDSRITDCLVIQSDRHAPRWFPWSNKEGNRSQISCAVHSDGNLVAWSHSVHELNIVDLSREKSPSVIKILPEPAGAKTSAQVVFKGMRPH
jgi:hypothetical protein